MCYKALIHVTSNRNPHGNIYHHSRVASILIIAKSPKLAQILYIQFYDVTLFVSKAFSMFIIEIEIEREKQFK